MEPSVEVRSLSVGYTHQRVLENIDLDIYPGQVVALLGNNGVGKSTLIACLLGLGTHFQGSVKILGEHPKRVRHRIGVMLQENALPSTLSVREILWTFQAYHRQYYSLDCILDLIGMKPHQTQRYGRLSGGQKQRLHFGLALLGNPDLIFLDEPTNGMDIESKWNFWNTVQHLKQSGKTIVLTTHQIDEIETVANRIVLLKDKKIAFDGQFDELIERKETVKILFNGNENDFIFLLSKFEDVVFFKDGDTVNIEVKSDLSDEVVRAIVFSGMKFENLKIGGVSKIQSISRLIAN